MSLLADALRSGRVLLMDGAAGTEFLRAGLTLPFEQLNLMDPERVRALHRSYVAAGAEIILTNTFQAWRVDEPIRDTYATAVALARAAAPRALVLADVGPWGRLESQVPAVLEGCRAADGVLLETWSDVGQVRLFADLQRQGGCESPLLISFTFGRGADGALRTFRDATPEQCARTAEAAGAVALGVNCGLDIGLPELLDIVKCYRSVTRLPVFARPNAGSPQSGAALQTPDAMAAWLPHLFDAGVTMIGGCCGTTPAHIAAFRKEIDAWNERRG